MNSISFKRAVPILLTSFFFILGFGPAFSQAPSASQIKIAYDKLAKAYQEKQLSKEAYLKQVDSLASVFLGQGIHFETRDLSDYLALYESIAWSDENFKSNRYSYYQKFMNNARMFGKNGASIYYAEKMSEQARANGDAHPLIEMLQKFDIYIGQGLFDKIVQAYEKEEKYIRQLPSLLKNNKVKPGSGLDAIYILHPTVTAYLKTDNKRKARETAQLANQIGEELKRQDSVSRQILLNTDLFLISIPIAMAVHEKDNLEVGALLKKLEGLKTTYKDINTIYVDGNLFKWRLHYFLQTRNADSLSFYIKEMEKYPTSSNKQKAHIAAYKGDVQAIMGNYKESYDLLHEAITLYQQSEADVTVEMDTLLYAHTEAEHNQIALEKAEKVKQQRTIWLIGISGLAVTIILGIYLLMQKRNKKAQQIIYALNDTANIQIALMEEARDQAKRDEQHRLSRELHDGLSGTLASLKNRLEIQINSLDGDFQEDLQQLKQMTEQVYAEVRGRSHTLYDKANTVDENRFRQHIIDLAQAAFPNAVYAYDVIIDEDALDGTSFEFRSHLIRIVQESFANILKHAKATAVSILMYHEQTDLILEVQDNGEGMKKAQKRGLGLQSMFTRIKEMDGKLEIKSSEEGTLITCIFPIDRESNV